MKRKRVARLCASLEVPELKGHPNRLAFEGCLTLLDVPSDKAPSGTRGHRVILTRAAAAAALPGLLGMGVGYKAGWGGHDARQKVGIVTEARIAGRELRVTGFVYGRDCPELKLEMGERLDELGMSYEMVDCHVADMRAPIWTLARVTFTGAAVLLKAKAAYKRTSFRLVGQPAKLKAAA